MFLSLKNYKLNRLIGLRIQIHLTPKDKPYKQGAVEKSPQTMQIQVVEGQSFSTWFDLFKRRQIRRQRLPLVIIAFDKRKSLC